VIITLNLIGENHPRVFPLGCPTDAVLDMN